jgi:hypothetical protein
MIERRTEFDVALIRLRRADWSVGAAAFDGPGGGEVAWLVSGSNGENPIRGWGPTRDEAWREAIGQARAVRMIGAGASRRGDGAGRDVPSTGGPPRYNTPIPISPSAASLGDPRTRYSGGWCPVPMLEPPAVSRGREPSPPITLLPPDRGFLLIFNIISSKLCYKLCDVSWGLGGSGGASGGSGRW